MQNFAHLLLAQQQKGSSNVAWRTHARQIKKVTSQKPVVSERPAADGSNLMSSVISNNRFTISAIESKLLSRKVSTYTANQRSELTQSSRLQHQESEPYLSHFKQLSHIKSDLVRRNVVTRSSLVKQYQPPVRTTLKAENNPFLTDSLLSYAPYQKDIIYQSVLQFRNQQSQSQHQSRLPDTAYLVNLKNKLN